MDAADAKLPGARDGFEVDWFVSLSLAMYHERLSKGGDGKNIFFRP